jgi:HEAT repeat protein
MTLQEISERIRRAARSPGVPKGAAPVSPAVLLHLRAHGDEGRTLLEELLTSEVRNERILSAQLLGQLNLPSAVPALAQACDDADFIVSSVASRALAFMDGPAATAALNALTKAPANQGVEVNALFGLCRTNDPPGIELALAYLENPSVSFEGRIALAGSLAMLSDRHLLPVVDHAAKLFPNHGVVQSLASEFHASLSEEAAAQNQ